MVNGKGHEALAPRAALKAPTQVTIVNSIVGQLALGHAQNIDVFVILEAAELALEQVDAPQETDAEARSVLKRMREAGDSAVSTTAREVLAAVVRPGLGPP